MTLSCGSWCIIPQIFGTICITLTVIFLPVAVRDLYTDYKRRRNKEE